MAFRDVLDVGHFSSAFLQAVNVQLWQAGKKLLLNKCSSILVSNKKKKALLKKVKGAKLIMHFSLYKKKRDKCIEQALSFSELRRNEFLELLSLHLLRFTC